MLGIPCGECIEPYHSDQPKVVISEELNGPSPIIRSEDIGCTQRNTWVELCHQPHFEADQRIKNLGQVRKATTLWAGVRVKAPPQHDISRWSRGITECDIAQFCNIETDSAECDGIRAVALRAVLRY